MKIEPGIYDISNEQYHASAGLSRSAMMMLLKSPEHFYRAYVLREPEARKTTPAMLFGTAFHQMILEPDAFNIRNFSLTHADIKALDLMKKSLESNEDAMTLIKGAEIEKSIYWKDEKTGILCKARPDIMFLDGEDSYIGDLKSTKDASKGRFHYEMLDYGYYLQAVFAQEAIWAVKKIHIKNFWAIPCEKNYPFMSNIYKIKERRIEEARLQFREALRLYKRCMESNSWPGYLAEEIG